MVSSGSRGPGKGEQRRWNDGLGWNLSVSTHGGVGKRLWKGWPACHESPGSQFLTGCAPRGLQPRRKMFHCGTAPGVRQRLPRARDAAQHPTGSGALAQGHSLSVSLQHSGAPEDQGPPCSEARVTTVLPAQHMQRIRADKRPAPFPLLPKPPRKQL